MIIFECLLTAGSAILMELWIIYCFLFYLFDPEWAAIDCAIFIFELICQWFLYSVEMMKFESEFF
jgi:hypothetical protein